MGRHLPLVVLELVMTDDLEDLTLSKRAPVAQQQQSMANKAVVAPNLRSPRLHLRPPKREDADAILEALSDRGIAEMTTTIPHPYQRQDALDWIDVINQSWAARAENDDDIRGGAFVICHRDSGKLLGACGIRTREDVQFMELGYWIARDHWGQGYATEAAHLAIDWAFSAYQIDAIKARYRPINPASQRVLEKCGFQPDGSELINSVAAGQVLVNTCRLDRAVWRAIRRWGGGTPSLPTEML